MRKVPFLHLLVILLTAGAARAGLPPTTTQAVGDAAPVVTFNFSFPNFAVSRTGVTTTFGLLGAAGGGTGIDSSGSTGLAHLASGTWSYSSLVNADVSSSAAIVYSKLSLGGSILNSDLAGSIAASKLIGSDIATVGTITSGTWNAGQVTSSSTIAATASNAGGSTTVNSHNTSNAANTVSQMLLQNDTNSFLMQHTSSSATQTGPALTNGPTTAQAILYTNASEPIVIGTAATAAVIIDASQGVTLKKAILAPGLAASSASTTGTLCWTTSTGNFTVDTTTTCLLSTRKIKENIDPLDAGLETVMHLRPVAYNLKPEHNPSHLGRQVGLISEEVAEVDPRLVSRDATGEPLGVRYMQLTAVLVHAIQEQQAEIETLKAQMKEGR